MCFPLARMELGRWILGVAAAAADAAAPGQILKSLWARTRRSVF